MMGSDAAGSLATQQWSRQRYRCNYGQVGSIRATWPWARLLPPDLIHSSFEVRGKFQALRPLAPRARPPKHTKRCFPRNPETLLHCLEESSRKKLLNTLVKSICHCECVEQQVKNRFPKIESAGIPSLAGLRPFCASGGFQDLRPLCAALLTPT